MGQTILFWAILGLGAVINGWFLGRLLRKETAGAADPPDQGYCLASLLASVGLLLLFPASVLPVAQQWRVYSLSCLARPGQEHQPYATACFGRQFLLLK